MPKAGESGAAGPARALLALPRMRSPPGLLVALVFLGSCSGEVGPADPQLAGGDGDSDVDSDSDADPPRRQGPCRTFDLAALDSCCDEGEAHCVPLGTYPEELEAQGAPCGESGVCMPDVVIIGGEGYSAPPCVSIGDAEGVCVSVCVPEVRENGSILPQATCADSEKCVPCVNPLTGEDTGVCGQTLTCGDGSGGEGEGEGEPEPEWSCENPPSEPVIDPTIFPACCDGAHCVPEALVPGEEAALLGACGDDGAGKCVPDSAIVSNGFFTAPTCVSVAGSEGRCLSRCLPDVAAQAANLPQATCVATEVCVPCCDPFTGQASGACEAGCDVGPAAECTGVPAFPTCCEDSSGHCIPGDMVPDDQEENLDECDTQDGSTAFCVPDVMQDPNFAGARCFGEQLFGDGYDGVCLPDCLDIPLAFTMDEADCPANYLCVPCTNPLTGEPSGAPGC